VQVDATPGQVVVQGPKGKLTHPLPAGIAVAREGDALRVTRVSEGRQERSLHGLTRKLVANMVEGVSTGFTRTLEIIGVGYRADARGNTLYITVGYSHPIVYQLPPGIQVKVDKQTMLTLEGIDRQLLGEVAAGIRALRPPEPYKGKGIKYVEERIQRKAGKAAGAAGGK
jgi:large subunit ribosomal protein L6